VGDDGSRQRDTSRRLSLTHTTTTHHPPTHTHTRQVERLVCGNPNLDFEALERNSKYEGGFSVATPAVQWLWQVGGFESCRCV
jgi:hypothetical protein